MSPQPSLTRLFAAGLGALVATPFLHAEPVADFLLEDLNPTSPRYQQMVSPRDYLHQVTAYYFGLPT